MSIIYKCLHQYHMSDASLSVLLYETSVLINWRNKSKRWGCVLLSSVHSWPTSSGLQLSNLPKPNACTFDVASSKGICLFQDVGGGKLPEGIDRKVGGYISETKFAKWGISRLCPTAIIYNLYNHPAVLHTFLNKNITLAYMFLIPTLWPKQASLMLTVHE